MVFRSRICIETRFFDKFRRLIVYNYIVTKFLAKSVSSSANDACSLTLVICKVSFRDLLKFSTAKNWLFHRILHVDISKKWPSDGRFEPFLVDFLLFENKKVALNGEILEPTQMVQMPKFCHNDKIQLKS